MAKMTRMARKIFWFAFIVSLLFQGLRWASDPIADQTIWTQGAESVQTQNPSTFPELDAYMHPGGPVIEGAIAIHELSHASYIDALNAFLILFSSGLIAGICLLCYLLRGEILWPLTVLGLLSFQSLYDVSLFDGLTPPSVIEALALPLLALLTLYLYENKSPQKKFWSNALWCVIAGFSAATRIDAGAVMVLALLFLLMTKYDFKKIGLMALGSFAAFCIFDPFMWFAPVTQVTALISSVLTHYGGPGGYSSVLVYFSSFPKVGMIALVGVFLGLAFVLFRKEVSPPVPPRFLVFVLIATALLAFVFLTASVQASRYFMPLIFIWEIFMPFFVFSLISQVRFSFVKTEADQKRATFIFKLIIIALLVGPLATIFFSQAISHGVFELL
jgi:hypothetical protein